MEIIPFKQRYYTLPAPVWEEQSNQTSLSQLSSLEILTSI